MLLCSTRCIEGTLVCDTTSARGTLLELYMIIVTQQKHSVSCVVGCNAKIMFEHQCSNILQCVQSIVVICICKFVSFALTCDKYGVRLLGIPLGSSPIFPLGCAPDIHLKKKHS
jgi:hypothetical protein